VVEHKEHAALCNLQNTNRLPKEVHQWEDDVSEFLVFVEDHVAVVETDHKDAQVDYESSTLFSVDPAQFIFSFLREKVLAPYVL